MARPLQVGVQLPEVEYEPRWSELATMARTAEDIGLDSVWLGDHYLSRDERGTRGPWEAWTQLAAIAAITSRVRIGPLVASTSFHQPAVLAKLHAEEGAAGSAAFARLWRHAADALLARSAEPPPPPGDWTIAANAGCRCEHCDRLRDFCKDPKARTARFPLRTDLRAHLHQIIDGQELDIEHVTERRGRPFTLVCTKTRASHKRRRAEYAKDVSCMQGLIESAPGGEQAADCASDLAAVRAAVTASETA